MIPLKNRDGRRGRRPSRTEKARHLKNLGRVRGHSGPSVWGFSAESEHIGCPLSGLFY